MIRFSCSNCGAAFKVKDEHAGKRVKCPKCATANTVPAADDDEEVEAPAARAPVKSARTGGRSGSRSGGRARASRKHSTEGTPKWMAPAIILAVVIGGIVIAIKSMEGPDYGKMFRDADTLMTEGKAEEAVALLAAIPVEDTSFSGQVQEKLVEARKLVQAKKDNKTAKSGTVLYNWIQQVKDQYLDDNTDPAYAPTTRFLLKRAREFETLYPDHPKYEEVRKLHSYYRNVASIDNPPTEDDVRAELRFRRFSNDFHLGFDAIDEFARLSDPPTEVLDALRAEFRSQAMEDWSGPDGDKQQAEAAIAKGNYGTVITNLKKLVEGYAPFAEASREIADLLARAESKGG